MSPAQPPGTPPARRPAGTRLRYGRLTAFSLSVLVTLTTLLGGVGVLPDGADPVLDSAPERGEIALAAAEPAEPTAPSSSASFAADPAPAAATDVSLPADSGEGRRVVFDIGDQRVWLVRGNGTVARTYLVSGSIYDNLDPGSYEVYSRSERAWGIDDSGTMRYMVRFTRGDNAAIGFHDIPIDDGKLVQTRAELGTPLSHGCVRQWRPDAKALWRFAPVGTTVVVTA